MRGAVVGLQWIGMRMHVGKLRALGRRSGDDVNAEQRGVVAKVIGKDYRSNGEITGVRVRSQSQR